MPRTEAAGEPLLRKASLYVVGPLVVGLVLAPAILVSPYADPNHPELLNVFLYLYAHHEPIHFALLIVLSAAFSALAFRGQRGAPVLAYRWPVALSWPVVVLLGLMVLAVTGLGARLVFHNYPLSGDEFAADFQSRVFAAGQIRAAIPREWTPFVAALTPVYVGTGAEGDSWTSAYLPIAAAIRAVFVVAGVPDLTNPALAALTVPVVWLVARRLWPDEPAAAWVPAVLLAASSQFIFTSMTAYAMPAHLLLNMAWLYLYLVGTRASLAAVPVVGVLAMGLHQLNVHALFVAPFLLRLVLTRRWGIATYFAVVYLLGAALWIGWLVRFNPLSGALPASVFALPGALQVLLQPMNLGLLVSWQPMAMSLLALVAFLRWRSMTGVMRDIALGVLLTLAFFVFVDFDQGQGWGYRYAYGVLGNVALLAGQGWSLLDEEWRRSRGLAFLTVSVVIALAIQVPIRAIQIESHVSPFADSMAFVQSLPVDVALIQRTDAWYAHDLVRNDPWLTNSPKVMLENRLTDTQTEALRTMGRIRRVEGADLAQLGMMVRRLSS